MTSPSSDPEKAAAGSYVPLAVTYRSDVLESVHHGAVVALNEDGSVAFSYGDPLVGIFPRSSTKPLQAHAMLSAGLISLMSYWHWSVRVMMVAPFTLMECEEFWLQLV